MPEDLQQQINDLQNKLENLTDLYFRTNFIDKVVHSNPVYFNGKLFFKEGLVIELGANTGTKLGSTGNKLGFLGATPIVRAGAITAPTGGATIDAEARTAINSIRTVLTNFGLTN